MGQAKDNIDDAVDFIRQAAIKIALLEPKNTLQMETKDDFLIALAGIQSTELLAVRRAFE